MHSTNPIQFLDGSNPCSTSDHTVPLMRSMHLILPKETLQQQATKAGDVEVWIAQVVVQ